MQAGCPRAAPNGKTSKESGGDAMVSKANRTEPNAVASQLSTFLTANIDTPGMAWPRLSPLKPVRRSADPEEDQVYYRFDWDDGRNTGWLGPYYSDETCTATHTWSTIQTYNVKVKSKDIHSEESQWSDPLPVSMPYKHQTLWELIIEWILQIFGISIP